MEGKCSSEGGREGGGVKGAKWRVGTAHHIYTLLVAKAYILSVLGMHLLFVPK